MYSLGVLAFTSFLLALVLTPLWRNLCRRWGWVDRPDGGRRLHRVPVPRVGGVPIFAAYLGAMAVVVLSPLAGGDIVQAGLPMAWRILPGAALVFAAGLAEASLEDKLSIDASRCAYPDYPVALQRNFAPLQDLIALVQLWWLIVRIRPHVVHTYTPKAGLLGMIAAALGGVRIRIYTINGLVLSTRRGWQRVLLRLTERIACRLAHRVLCVSPSLRAEVLALGLCSPEKAKVLGYGSSHGVNLERFHPTKARPEIRAKVRAAWRIPDDAIVIGFVGRLVRDKGIGELAEAWTLLARQFRDLHLLLCGGFEGHDPVPAHAVNTLQHDPRVHITGGFVADMPSMYAGMDICVLPTYREGLPNVPLECGAMGIPIVATRVTGCVDAVVDGETGLLVPPGDASALADALRRLIVDSDLRERLGKQARTFIASRFSEEYVNQLLVEEYCQLLSAAGLPVPRRAEHPVVSC